LGNRLALARQLHGIIDRGEKIRNRRFLEPEAWAMDDKYFDDVDPFHLNDIGPLVAALGTLVVLVLVFLAFWKF
jgi:hypothetical protein